MGITRNGRTTEQVRYKEVSIAQTFGSRTAAAAWKRRVHAAIDEGRWPDRTLIPPHLHAKWGLARDPVAVVPVDDSKPHGGWTVAKALEHYAQQVDIEKGSKQKLNRINHWVASETEICSRPLNDPELPDLLQKFVWRRNKTAAANTVRNDVFTIAALYTFATMKYDTKGREGWKLNLTSPTKDLVLPPQGGYRDRRLLDAVGEVASEEDRLLAACAHVADGEDMRALIVIAIDTAMRMSEVLDIRREQVQTTGGRPRIVRPDSKTGKSRNVLLSPRAHREVSALLRRKHNQDRVFDFDTAAVEYRWKMIRKLTGIRDLKFHDLRHEGLSRLAASGLGLHGLRQMSGHASTTVLMRYIKHKDEEIAAALGW